MNSASLCAPSIQLSISKKRMKFDLPEPFAPIRTAALGIPVKLDIRQRPETLDADMIYESCFVH